MACSAINCSNRPSKGSKVQFFRFPLADGVRLEQWFVRMRRKDWKPSKTSRLCSSHFEDDQFIVDVMGRRRLKDSALPTIFNFPSRRLRVKAQSPAAEVETVSQAEEVSEFPVWASRHVDQPQAADGVTEETRTEMEPNGGGQEPPSVSSDHSYAVSESPRTLRRKIDALQDRLVDARRKLKLKCQLARREKSKLSSLRDQISVLQNKLQDSYQSAAASDSMDDVPRQILRRIQSGKQAAFPQELQQFAAQLHLYSPQAYNFVRAKFNFVLPHPQTLLKWHSGTSADRTDRRKPSPGAVGLVGTGGGMTETLSSASTDGRPGQGSALPP